MWNGYVGTIAQIKGIYLDTHPNTIINTLNEAEKNVLHGKLFKAGRKKRKYKGEYIMKPGGEQIIVDFMKERLQLQKDNNKYQQLFTTNKGSSTKCILRPRIISQTAACNNTNL